LQCTPLRSGALGVRAGAQACYRTCTVEDLLPRWVCCPWLCAMPAQHAMCSGQAQRATSPPKNHVTSKSPVGDISVVTLIRTDTTLDHSQKAEKVCLRNAVHTCIMPRLAIGVPSIDVDTHGSPASLGLSERRTHTMFFRCSHARDVRAFPISV